MKHGRSALAPSYRLHKATGQARVTINGRTYYLGKHGTECDDYHLIMREDLLGPSDLINADFPREIDRETCSPPADSTTNGTIWVNMVWCHVETDVLVRAKLLGLGANFFITTYVPIPRLNRVG